MREIKFRAWDKKKGRMMHGYCNLVIMLDGHLNWNFGGELKWLSDLEKDYVLMQYTGLKEKNGKEIYEGDIISDGYIKREVKYGAYEFLPFSEELDERDHFTILGALYSFEVIGNIYADPELLSS